MKRSIARTLVLAALSLLALPAPAAADLIVYSTRADYDAATTNNTVLDFEGIANDMEVVDHFGEVTLGGVHFRSDSSLFTVGRYAYYWEDSVLTSTHAPSSQGLDVTLPGAFNAFAVEVGTFFPTQITFEFSTGDTHTITVPGYDFFNGLAFVGFTSDVAFVSVRLQTGANESTLNVDDVTFGYALADDAVPAPPALLLAAVGVAGLAGFRRSRRRL